MRRKQCTGFSFQVITKFEHSDSGDIFYMIENSNVKVENQHINTNPKIGMLLFCLYKCFFSPFIYVYQ